jgi:hypothetical protein
MSYFKDVKVGDKVFGLIYGPGTVNAVWEDSFYSFEVEYDEGSYVPYTADGIPAWSSLDIQTVFYKKDIDIFDLDFSPVEDVLSAKKIIKLRDKKMLEARCPSGLWSDVSTCPYSLIEAYLENKKFHLFRKKV